MKQQASFQMLIKVMVCAFITTIGMYFIAYLVAQIISPASLFKVVFILAYCGEAPILFIIAFINRRRFIAWLTKDS